MTRRGEKRTDAANETASVGRAPELLIRQGGNRVTEMVPSSLEDRLAALERDLSWLKQQLSPAAPPQSAEAGNWLEAVSGSFKDDPEFDEVLRLGRLARPADAPGEDEQPRRRR